MDPNQPTTGQPVSQPGTVPTDQPVQPQPAPMGTPTPTPEPVEPVQPETTPQAPVAEEPKAEEGGGVPPVVPPASQV